MSGIGRQSQLTYDPPAAEAESIALPAADSIAPAELATPETAGAVVCWAMAAAAKVRMTAERMMTEIGYYQTVVPRGVVKEQVDGIC